MINLHMFDLHFKWGVENGKEEKGTGDWARKAAVSLCLFVAPSPRRLVASSLFSLPALQASSFTGYIGRKQNRVRQSNLKLNIKAEL
jgi:hypothetical protein